MQLYLHFVFIAFELDSRVTMASLQMITVKKKFFDFFAASYGFLCGLLLLMLGFGLPSKNGILLHEPAM